MPDEDLERLMALRDLASLKTGIAIDGDTATIRTRDRWGNLGTLVVRIKDVDLAACLF